MDYELRHRLHAIVVVAMSMSRNRLGTIPTHCQTVFRLADIIIMPSVHAICLFLGCGECDKCLLVES